MQAENQFWKNKTLAEMTAEEWELLCDGCGYCCLVKLEDEDDGAIYTTNVACRLLDTTSCRCQDYPGRQSQVKTCLVLSNDKPELFDLLPETCAYRRLYEGSELPVWHPLLQGDCEAMHVSGVSVCEYAVSEEYVHPEQMQDHVIHRLR
ncbi:MAG: YcgN family cysteine cluster protein [Gammaproteobacteria bacterium]|nr:YcgN family cysteine cluster protein [Gammaproteobacteria bacterium]